MHLKLLLVGLALSVQAVPAMAITIDGRLDEPQWRDAKRIDAFAVVQPMSDTPPDLATELLVHTDERGMYFGFRVEQPRTLTRTRHRTARDAQARADRVNLIVDFDGRGATAYEFTVSISGGIQDAIISNQRSFSYDWDGLWFHAVHEEADYWSVEIHLPWTVAPMGTIVDGQREIGIYASRVVEGQGRRFSYPAYDFDRPTFVADMARIRVDAWDTPSLDLLPYVSASRDRLGRESDLRVGMDVFWRPNARNQISATLRPDFGQVESDDLVVDFGAIETFFSEKRPFFTENQSLFDLATTNGGRLVNTRRIGAAPDRGPEGSSDIDAALKYTGSGEAADWGVFVATEDDSELARGRDFGVLRGRHRGERLQIGYLGTWASRPTLDRRARVHAMDWSWLPTAGTSLRGQVIGSQVRQSPVAANGFTRVDDDGLGGWARLDHAPSSRWTQRVEASYYDRDYNINDLGFMRRNDFRDVLSATTLYRRNYPAESAIQNSSWYLETHYRENLDGDRINASQMIERVLRLRSTGQLAGYVVYRAPFTDDLITRGHGRVGLGTRHEARVSYDTPRYGRVRVFSYLRWLQEGEDGSALETAVEPTWFASDDLSTSLRLTWRDSSDWLIWRGDNRLASYRRDQGSLFWNLNWFPADGHEVRLRAQYIGLRARARQSFEVVGGELLPTALVDEDFSLGNLAMQLRYRYELAPMSEFFFVYSRGGSAELDDTGSGFGELFSQTRVGVIADQVLVKLRYRF